MRYTNGRVYFTYLLYFTITFIGVKYMLLIVLPWTPEQYEGQCAVAFNSTNSQSVYQLQNWRSSHQPRFSLAYTSTVSVRPSVSSFASKPVNVCLLRLFSQPGNPTILVFTYQTFLAIFLWGTEASQASWIRNKRLSCSFIHSFNINQST